MSETPFPSGVPIMAALDAAEPASQPTPWRDVAWVGFADDDAPEPFAEPPAAGAAAAHSMSRVRRAGTSLRHLVRIAGVAATMGVVAVFAYQGGERLAGLVASPAPSAPVHPSPALAAAESEPEPAPPPASLLRGDPAGTPAERAAYYLSRARGGDPVAQYDIATLYAKGDGIANDLTSAAAWFREAASAGNPAAEFNLAVMYEQGLGIGQKNLAEAAQWYRRAAQQHYAPAQYNLAVAYAEGRGLPRDPVAAAGWYRHAAEQGLVPAMVNLAILYETGEGIARSLPEAYAWYRAAARGGDTIANARAQELFRQFSGPEKGRAVVAAEALTDIRYRTPALASPDAPAAGAADRAPPAAKPRAAHAAG